MRVQVDEAWHERSESVVFHGLVRVQRLEVLEVPDLNDLVVLNQDSTVLDMRSGDRKHIASSEQHEGFLQ